MNDEGARQGAPDTINHHLRETVADLRDIGSDLEPVRCEDCGHVSPSRLHLERHQLRHCCGRMGRAA